LSQVHSFAALTLNSPKTNKLNSGDSFHNTCYVIGGCGWNYWWVWSKLSGGCGVPLFFFLAGWNLWRSLCQVTMSKNTGYSYNSPFQLE